MTSWLNLQLGHLMLVLEQGVRAFPRLGPGKLFWTERPLETFLLSLGVSKTTAACQVTEALDRAANDLPKWSHGSLSAKSQRGTGCE